MRRILRALGVGVLALLAGGCSLQASAALPDGPLNASGVIRAREVRVSAEFGGRVQNVAVTVGDVVTAGEVLVTLDATPWLLQLAPSEAAIEVARADLVALEAGAHPAEIEAARGALALAIAQRDGAQVAWENALAVAKSPQTLDAQIVEARTQLALAQQGSESGRAQLAREQVTRDLTSKDSLQRKMADLKLLASQESLAAALANEKTAQTLLTQLQSIRNRPLGYLAQAHAAEGQYHVAEAAVAVAQARLDDLLAGPTPEEVAVARAEVQRAEAEANVLQVKVERSTLTSPIDGVVVSQAARVGELAAPAAAILTLADLSRVTLDVYVPENRVGQVTLGQTVQVRVDSFPERVFEGRVAAISDTPEFTPRNVATAEERLNTFYAVEVRLENPERLLKPGMPADAEF